MSLILTKLRSKLLLQDTVLWSTGPLSKKTKNIVAWPFTAISSRVMALFSEWSNLKTAQ